MYAVLYYFLFHLDYVTLAPWPRSSLILCSSAEVCIRFSIALIRI